MLHANLPLGVRLDLCFGWMQSLAQAMPDVEQRHAVMVLFQKLTSALGETEITVQVPMVHILCQACDDLRLRGKSEEVRIIEELIKALKGEEQRTVSGTLQLSAKNIAELDGRLEDLRKIITAGR